MNFIFLRVMEVWTQWGPFKVNVMPLTFQGKEKDLLLFFFLAGNRAPNFFSKKYIFCCSNFPFCRYCTRSFLTMMAGVGVAHKLLKNKKKIIIQMFDKATFSSLNYLQEFLRDRHTKPCPCPTIGHYIVDLNPSAVSAETASVVSPFRVAIVLGKKENFSPYAFGRWYWKGWYSCYRFKQVRISVNNDLSYWLLTWTQYTHVLLLGPSY